MSKSTRGLWYEKLYKRWRVRLYRNGKAYLAGYFKTKPEAEAALVALKEKLKETGEPEAASSQLNTGVLAI